jgi:hypothetical protein
LYNELLSHDLQVEVEAWKALKHMYIRLSLILFRLKGRRTDDLRLSRSLSCSAHQAAANTLKIDGIPSVPRLRNGSAPDPIPDLEITMHSTPHAPRPSFDASSPPLATQYVAIDFPLPSSSHNRTASRRSSLTSVHQNDEEGGEESENQSHSLPATHYLPSQPDRASSPSSPISSIAKKDPPSLLVPATNLSSPLGEDGPDGSGGPDSLRITRLSAPASVVSSSFGDGSGWPAAAAERNKEQKREQQDEDERLARAVTAVLDRSRTLRHNR